MNPRWLNFLASHEGAFDERGRLVFPSSETENMNRVYALTHLSVLKVSGSDAAKFLQGQVTCNVLEVSEMQGRMGAFCNAKGRAITTFLLVKEDEDFLMILPSDLLRSVQEKLQRYVLRAKVVLTDCSETLCLVAASKHENTPGNRLFQTVNDQGEHRTNGLAIVISKIHTLFMYVVPIEHAETFWWDCVKGLGYHPSGSAEWQRLEMLAGIPWLTPETSEEFIPQMLNLDKLGGISFNKGCYTGQEIVARTHFLGKVKRELWLAEGQASKIPEPSTGVTNLDTDNRDLVGTVVNSVPLPRHPGCFILLIVLHTAETAYHSLGLIDDDQARLTLRPIAYDE